MVALAVKNPPARAGDIGDTVSVSRFLGEEMATHYSVSIQYSCLKNPMDRGA